MTSKDPNLVKTPIDKTAETIRSDLNTHKESIDQVSIDPTVTDQPVFNNAENTNVAEIDTDQAEKNVNTEHVNEGDLAARNPDRRDQVGQPFDGGINDQSTVDSGSQSEDLNVLNRYANVDNAQTRVLPTNEQQPE